MQDALTQAARDLSPHALGMGRHITPCFPRETSAGSGAPVVGSPFQIGTSLKSRCSFHVMAGRPGGGSGFSYSSGT